MVSAEAVRAPGGAVGFSFKELARHLEESLGGLQAAPPSLVTEEQGNAHNRRKRPDCNNKLIFQEVSGFGGWRWTGKACDRWTCDACYRWRLETELIPEIVRALAWAREKNWTLKFLTLTYSPADFAATLEEGKERRRLDLQHLVQSLRRRGYEFEYLKIVETHKSGKVHLHLLVLCDFIPQELLSDLWERATRGTSRIVHIEAAFQKCPRCWPGPKASKAEKERSKIIPPPGKAECRCCGYKLDWVNHVDGVEAAQGIAAEVSKYLSKELAMRDDKARVKKLTRSKGWAERCRPKPEDEELAVCEHCGVRHRFVFVGRLGKLIEEGFGGLEDFSRRDSKVAYFKKGGQPSACFGEDVVWRESKSESWGLGLVDQVGPANSELLGDWVRDGPG